MKLGAEKIPVRGCDNFPAMGHLLEFPSLWPEFRKALAQGEAAMIEAGWLDEEDLAT